MSIKIKNSGNAAIAVSLERILRRYNTITEKRYMVFSISYLVFLDLFENW